MAKFYGEIGYAVQEEIKPGVWKERIVKRNYLGETTRFNRSVSGSANVNDNINISCEISIVADPFANENFQYMCYIVYKGAKWKITSVNPQYPRLLLTVGGVYNGK